MKKEEREQLKLQKLADRIRKLASRVQELELWKAEIQARAAWPPPPPPPPAERS